jgi:aldehyde dehydrogenase (NAD+)
MENLLTDLQTEVTSIFDVQHNYQHIVKQTTAAERIVKLRKLQRAILHYKDEIADAINRDFGKPPFEALTTEILLLVNEINDVCNNLEGWMKRTQVTSGLIPIAKGEIIYEPRGVVLIIGPWNFPFLLLISPLIPTIAAGNTAILKPSELTPGVSAITKKLINDTFNEQEIAVVEGGVDITSQLLELPFDHIFFTGSPKVGKVVMGAAAKHLTSITLELGGKSPAVIDGTADMDKAVNRIIRGKTLNAGQICMSPDYLLISADKLDEFISKAKATIDRELMKDGKFNNSDYSQIVNQRNFDRLKYLFDDAISKGAKVVFGGVFDHAGRRIQPTLLINVPADSAMMNEEIFGPILPVFTYDTKEEVVDFVRQYDKPLAYYIFSEDQSNIDYFLEHSTSGGVCINDTLLQGFEPNIPFGGVNNSGMGSYHGIFGFRELSHSRGVFYQSPQVPIDDFGQPPYAGKVETVLSQIK